MGKKNRNEITKRRTKSKQLKGKKRNLRLIESRKRPETQVVYRPGISEMEAPPGFRAIGMSQAVMEYSKPLMKFVEDGKCEIKEVLELSMLLWNHSSAVQRGEETIGDKKDIIRSLSAVLKASISEAEELFQNMVKRFDYLLPKDKQPENKLSPFMFIRKELRTIISPFNYNSLRLSDKVIAPDQKDRELINKINELDQFVMEESEYTDYEDLLNSLKDECKELFEKWLKDKGLINHLEAISNSLNIYFDFIYAYMHDEVITLKSVPHNYFVEFFTDYLLRKVYAEPNEYVYWPPALKLFYGFLHEKKYIDNPASFINEINGLEPEFLEILKKQFT